jgi:hypothetical protein
MAQLPRLPKRPQKLTITPTGGRSVTVPFNPTEYSISDSNTYAEQTVEGLEAPLLQFVHGNNEVLTFDLLIDTTDQSGGARDANKLAKPIVDLMRIHGDRHAPPVCTFTWGGEILKGVIESLNRQFLLFDPRSGVPMRIRLSLTVRRYLTLEQDIAETNRQSPDRTKSVLVRRGDTLPAIAQTAYGDESMWRPIAVHNKISDPARLTPGQVLEVPAILPATWRGA